MCSSDLERRERACLGIQARDVWAFVEIAVDARQRQILEVVTTTMLFGNDVLDLESSQGRLILSEPAVLATVSRPQADGCTRGRIHRGY